MPDSVLEIVVGFAVFALVYAAHFINENGYALVDESCLQLFHKLIKFKRPALFLNISQRFVIVFQSLIAHRHSKIAGNIDMPRIYQVICGIIGQRKHTRFVDCAVTHDRGIACEYKIALCVIAAGCTYRIYKNLIKRANALIPVRRAGKP